MTKHNDGEDKNDFVAIPSATLCLQLHHSISNTYLLSDYLFICVYLSASHTTKTHTDVTFITVRSDSAAGVQHNKTHGLQEI